MADEAPQTTSVRGPGRSKNAQLHNYVYVLRNISRVLTVGVVAAAKEYVTLTNCLGLARQTDETDRFIRLASKTEKLLFHVG